MEGENPVRSEAVGREKSAGKGEAACDRKEAADTSKADSKKEDCGRMGGLRSQNSRGAAFRTAISETLSGLQGNCCSEGKADLSGVPDKA